MNSQKYYICVAKEILEQNRVIVSTIVLLLDGNNWTFITEIFWSVVTEQSHKTKRL